MPQQKVFFFRRGTCCGFFFSVHCTLFCWRSCVFVRISSSLSSWNFKHEHCFSYSIYCDGLRLCIPSNACVRIYSLTFVRCPTQPRISQFVGFVVACLFLGSIIIWLMYDTNFYLSGITRLFHTALPFMDNR